MTSYDPERALRGRDLAWLAVVLVATLAVFWRALGGELVYDDLLLIARNPDIADLANVPSLFAKPYWDFAVGGTADQIGYWRPLSAVAHALSWAAGGGDPRAFHAASLLLHAAAASTAFLFARRLFGGRAWPAGLTALLFALHPTKVESVAWISALNDPLFGLFSLAALHTWLRWRQRGSRRIALAAPGFLLLALLSKEMGIAVVPLLVVIDLGARGRARLQSAAVDYAPILVVLLGYYLARVLVFGDLLAGFGPDRTPTRFGVDTTRLLQLRVELLGGMLALLVWPFELTLFRPFRPALAWSSADMTIALGACVALVALAVLFLRRGQRFALAALLMIPAGFAPALAKVESLGRFPLSDRFLYVSSLGFALLVVLAARRFLPRRAAIALVGLLALGYGWKSWSRVAVWHDETVLFETAVRETPRSAYLTWGLGRVYIQRAAESGTPEDLAAAFAAFERAADLLTEARRGSASDLFVTSEDFLQTNLGLAQCYVLEARVDEFGSYSTAIAILEDLARRIGELQDQVREARELGLNVVAPHHRLELVYAALGTAYRLAGDAVQAESAYRKALSLDPRLVETHMGMGRLFSQRGVWNVAIHHFEEAARLRPGGLEERVALAQALRESGRRDEAEELAQQLIDEQAPVPEAYLVLASNRLEDRKEREALVWIDRALQVDREHGNAWYLKGLALQSLGVNQQAAIEALSKAAAFLPDDFYANYNYGMLLFNSGAQQASLPYLVTAYAEAPDELQAGRLFAFLQTLEEVFEDAQQVYRLATADGRRGRDDLAETWLDLALRMDPEHPDSLFQKGLLLARQRRYAEAETHLRRAVAVVPRNLALRIELARFLEERGNLVGALEELEHALEVERGDGWSDEEWAQLRAQLEERVTKLRAEVEGVEIGPRADGG